MSEIWKDIHGYERIYQISNLGRVKAKGNPYFCNGKQLDSDGRILKPQPNSKGYLRIYLTKNGSKKYFFIHRLVAEHFIPNPDELDTVNHKDFNPQNNSTENLEWTTRKGNMRYSADRGRFDHTEIWAKRIKRSLDRVMGKPVIGTEISTGRTIKLKALNDSRNYGFQPSCVCNCCKGIRQTHKGYRWKYDNEAQAK